MLYNLQDFDVYRSEKSLHKESVSFFFFNLTNYPQIRERLQSISKIDLESVTEDESK